MPVRGHQQPSEVSETREKQRDFQNDCETKYPRQGRQNIGFSREKPDSLQGGGAVFDAAKPPLSPSELSLGALADALSHLTPEQLEAILALSQAARKGGAK